MRSCMAQGNCFTRVKWTRMCETETKLAEATETGKLAFFVLDTRRRSDEASTSDLSSLLTQLKMAIDHGIQTESQRKQRVVKFRSISQQSKRFICTHPLSPVCWMPFVVGLPRSATIDSIVYLALAPRYAVAACMSSLTVR